MRHLLLSLGLTAVLGGCCCPAATVESEEQRYKNYLDRYEEHLEGNDLGRSDKQWLRQKQKKFRKQHKALPKDETSRLPALTELTGRMQDTAKQASDRAGARKAKTLVGLSEMKFGLGHQDRHIIGESKSFDTHELELWMVYRTKKHPPKGVKPTVLWQAKSKDGKYETVFNLTIEEMFQGDEGALTLHSNIYRDPKVLKSWPPGKVRVKVMYGENKQKSATFKFVE